jgi:hypothetical protein
MILLWFLVSIGTGNYIGPMSEAPCNLAAAILINEGIVCLKPDFIIACEGNPGRSSVCGGNELPVPHFAIPKGP